MLAITEQAATLIRELLEHADLSDSAGLRIAQRDDPIALAMTLVDERGPEDLVVDVDVPVFVGPQAARRVEDQTLDANTTDISAAFYLRD